LHYINYIFNSGWQFAISCSYSFYSGCLDFAVIEQYSFQHTRERLAAPLKTVFEATTMFTSAILPASCSWTACCPPCRMQAPARLSAQLNAPLMCTANTASIFRAELYALLLAIGVCHSKENNFMIFSDSMSNLQAINGFKIEQDLIQRFIMMIVMMRPKRWQQTVMFKEL